ncbi:MAG: carbohydrate kinase family protein [Pirellulales bacterium]
MHEHRGVKTKVVDTVGAGDSFTAAFTLGLLEQRPLDVINRTACQIAAYVCSQSGGTPRLPRELTTFE